MRIVALSAFVVHTSAWVYNFVGAPNPQRIPGHNLIRSTEVKKDGKTIITPEISAFAQSFLGEHTLPGISVGTVRIADGAISTEFGAWGNMTEDGDAVQPAVGILWRSTVQLWLYDLISSQTLFNIGSCSKAFLASALGIMMDDFAHGRNVTALPPALASISWDTKVKALLPGAWELDDDWASEKANLRDILSHVSGLTRY